MEKKFIIPAGTFLLGLATWIVLFVVYQTNDWAEVVANWPDILLGLVPGLLIAYSGLHCRQVGGPRVGNIVRAGVLLVLTLLSWWKASLLAAIFLLLCALITGILILLGEVKAAR